MRETSGSFRRAESLQGLCVDSHYRRKHDFEHGIRILF